MAMKPTLHNSTAHVLLYRTPPKKETISSISTGQGSKAQCGTSSIPYNSSLPVFIHYILSLSLWKPIHFSAAQCNLLPWQRELRAWCQAKCRIQQFSWWHRVPQLPPSLCRGKYQNHKSKRSKSAGSHSQDHFPSQPNAKALLGRELFFQSSAQLWVFFRPALVAGTRIGIFPAGIKLAYHLVSNLLGSGLDQHSFTISNIAKGYFAIEFSKVGFPAAPRYYLSVKQTDSTFAGKKKPKPKPKNPQHKRETIGW